MPKKLIITENQFKQLLQEELCISEIVANTTISVYNMIEESAKTKTDKETNEHFSKWNFPVNFDFFGSKIDCSVTCYNYFSKEYFEYSQITSDGWSVCLSNKLFFMGITVPMVSGQISRQEVMDTIQHELSHIYEQKMMGNAYSNNDAYSLLKTNMGSLNELISKTAKLIYGCIKSEQSGFVNGLYAYLMSQPEIFSMETLKKSDCWKLYEDMISIYNQFSDNPEFVKELKKYKMNLTKIEKLINNFINKIGKVVVKVKQDKFKKQGFREKI